MRVPPVLCGLGGRRVKAGVLVANGNHWLLLGGAHRDSDALFLIVPFPVAKRFLHGFIQRQAEVELRYASRVAGFF